MSSRNRTHSSRTFTFGSIESVPSRLPFSTGQYAYILPVYADHAADSTRHATPASVPIEALFRRPGPIIRRALSELLFEPEPERSLVSSFERMLESIEIMLPRDPTFARAGVVPLEMRIDVWPVEDEAGEERAILDGVANLSLAEVGDGVLYPADESAIRVMIEAAGSGGACRDLGDERCAICLEEFGGPIVDDYDDQKIVAMPCSHVYHKNCIVEWLRRNHKCPLCRFSMPVAAN